MCITNRLLPQAKQMGDTNYRLSNWKPEKKQCKLWQRQAQASLMGPNDVQSGKRQLLKLLTNQPAMQGEVSKHGDPSHERNSDEDNPSSTSVILGWVPSHLLLHHYPTEACHPDYVYKQKESREAP